MVIGWSANILWWWCQFPQVNIDQWPFDRRLKGGQRQSIFVFPSQYESNMIWRAFRVKKRFIKKMGQKIYKAERWKGILPCRTWLDMKAPRLRVNSSSRANQELSYHNIRSLLFLFRKRSYLHQAGLQMGKVRRKSGSQNTSWEVMQWLKHLSNRKLNRKVMWINNHLLFGPKVVPKYMYVSSWSFCTVIFLTNK